MRSRTPGQLAMLAGPAIPEPMGPMTMTTCVKIVFELDPAMCHAALQPAYSRATRPLRLVPCKGGVRLHRAGRAGNTHASPESLACELCALASRARTKAWFSYPNATTHDYWLDCWGFLLEAARQVTRHPAILALWGSDL